MDFDLDQDEEMLKALVERFVADQYDLERRRTYLSEDQGFSARNWALLGELGLIASVFDEGAGGLGAKPSAVAIIFRALARGLITEPLLESVFVAGSLFERTAKGALRDAWLNDLVTGKRRIAFAHKEHAARNSLTTVETLATLENEGWTLTGEKSLVPAAVGADAYIVSAKMFTSNGDHGEIGLFFVQPRMDAMTVRQYRTVDGAVASAIQFDNFFIDPDCRLDGGIDDIEHIEERAAIARSAEALGVMEMIFEETLDYLRTRKQFGKPIGSFQALQHRMVRQYANIEKAKSLLYFAVADNHSDNAARRRAVYGARAFIAEASVELGHEAMQMHGGMGVTDELIIGHAHKRILMLSRFPNDHDDALDRYAGVS